MSTSLCPPIFCSFFRNTARNQSRPIIHIVPDDFMKLSPPSQYSNSPTQCVHHSSCSACILQHVAVFFSAFNCPISWIRNPNQSQSVHKRPPLEPTTKLRPILPRNHIEPVNNTRTTLQNERRLQSSHDDRVAVCAPTVCPSG